MTAKRTSTCTTILTTQEKHTDTPLFQQLARRLLPYSQWVSQVLTTQPSTYLRTPNHPASTPTALSTAPTTPTPARPILTSLTRGGAMPLPLIKNCAQPGDDDAIGTRLKYKAFIHPFIPRSHQPRQGKKTKN